MVKWLGILIGTLRSVFGSRRDLVLENLALRQQVAVTLVQPSAAGDIREHDRAIDPEAAI